MPAIDFDQSFCQLIHFGEFVDKELLQGYCCLEL
jgi:hypothetical protein